MMWSAISHTLCNLNLPPVELYVPQAPKVCLTPYPCLVEVGLGLQQFDSLPVLHIVYIKGRIRPVISNSTYLHIGMRWIIPTTSSNRLYKTS